MGLRFAAAIKIRVTLACFEMACPQKKRPQRPVKGWGRPMRRAGSISLRHDSDVGSQSADPMKFGFRHWPNLGSYILDKVGDSFGLSGHIDKYQCGMIDSQRARF